MESTKTLDIQKLVDRVEIRGVPGLGDTDLSQLLERLSILLAEYAIKGSLHSMRPVILSATVSVAFPPLRQ